jgi:predicted HTH transcriptional regulator
MEEEPLEEIVRRPESQTFERKQSLQCRDDGLKSLCGMLNTDSAAGSVAFGIGPNGEFVGVEPGNLDTAQRTIAQSIRSNFAPPIQCNIQVVESEGRSVVVVSAQRNRAVPYHELDGRAFIREGTTTRQLTLGERQHLQRQRNRDLHTGPWKCDRCGAVAGTFSGIVVTDQGVHKSYACSCGGEFWPAV